VKLMK